MKALKLFPFFCPQVDLGVTCYSLAAHRHRGHFCVRLQNTDQRQRWQHWQIDLDVMIFQWASAGPHPYSLFIMLPTSSGFYLNLSLITTSPTRLKQHSGGILAADMRLKAVNSSLMKQYVNIWKIARRAYQTNLFPIYSPQWDNFSHTLYRQCGRSLP